MHKRTFYTVSGLIICMLFFSTGWAEECEIPHKLPDPPFVELTNSVEISRAHFWLDISGIIAGSITGVYGGVYMKTVYPYNFGYGLQKSASWFLSGKPPMKMLFVDGWGDASNKLIIKKRYMPIKRNRLLHAIGRLFKKSGFLRERGLKGLAHVTGHMFLGPLRFFGGPMLAAACAGDLVSNYVSFAYAAEIPVEEIIEDMVEAHIDLNTAASQFYQGEISEDELLDEVGFVREAFESGVPHLAPYIDMEYESALGKLKQAFPEHRLGKTEIQRLVSILDDQRDAKLELVNIFKESVLLLRDVRSAQGMQALEEKSGSDLHSYADTFVGNVTEGAEFDDLYQEAILMYGKKRYRDEVIQSIRKINKK